MKEVRSRDWQYLAQSVMQLVKGEKSHLKPLPKIEKKIMKRIKQIFRVAKRVYASTYANIFEQFQFYSNSLPLGKIDEIGNDF